jgi:hypothetical protein
MKGKANDEVAYAIAEKQLYSSHYFETALDLSLCIPANEDSANPSFLPDHGYGFRAGGPDRSKGIHRSRGCCRSFGFRSAKRSHDDPEYLGK